MQRLGRFWWAWVVLGSLSGGTLNGTRPLWLSTVHLGLGAIGVAIVWQVADTLPTTSQRHLRMIVPIAATGLVAGFTMSVTSHWATATVVESAATIAAATVYVVVLGRFASGLPRSEAVVTMWGWAKRWLAGTIVALVVTVLALCVAAVVSPSHGPNVLTVSAAIAGVGATLAWFIALLAIARATFLTRIGFRADR